MQNLYLQTHDVQRFINQNTPSFLANSAKTIVSTLGGASIGGIAGKALPFIEETYPGVLGNVPEYALNIIKPIFVEYLAPTIPSTNYIPIALAGIGGAIVFGFTYYRQRNLSVQVAVAKAALGTIPSRLITDSELVKLQNLLPSLKIVESLKEKLVITDNEINELVKIKDQLSAAKIDTKNILDALEQVLKANIDNDQDMIKIYNNVQDLEIDNQALVNQFFAESWDLNIVDQQKIFKFFDVNNIKTPYSPGSNPSSSIDSSNSNGEKEIEDVFYFSRKKNTDEEIPTDTEIPIDEDLNSNRSIPKISKSNDNSTSNEEKNQIESGNTSSEGVVEATTTTTTTTAT